MTQELLDVLCDLAREAGEKILDDKKRTSSVTFKGDASPLTSADLASNRAILAGLSRVDPSTKVMSEESASVPFDERKGWKRYFLVDPLDGTKEFIKGKKEYTVNIALIEDGIPTLGVVHVPEQDVTFAGGVNLGAFRSEGAGERTHIRVAAESKPVPRIVGSSSHASPEMAQFLALLGDHEILQFGSSLKICQVAEGSAHFYPRFGPTSEWDTGAGHAVVLGAGGAVLTSEGKPLGYNQKESVLNPPFFVLGPTDRNYLELATRAMAAITN